MWSGPIQFTSDTDSWAGTQFLVSGGLQPALVGSNPVHLIVYKVEPPVRALPTA
jgi:hypothetical protein